MPESIGKKLKIVLKAKVSGESSESKRVLTVENERCLPRSPHDKKCHCYHI